jgi:hypothetical protein
MTVLLPSLRHSRKTGYKILTRYDEIDLEGLTDHVRKARRSHPQRDQPVILAARLYLVPRTCLQRAQSGSPKGCTAHSNSLMCHTPQ